MRLVALLCRLLEVKALSLFGNGTYTEYLVKISVPTRLEKQRFSVIEVPMVTSDSLTFKILIVANRC